MLITEHDMDLSDSTQSVLVPANLRKKQGVICVIRPLEGDTVPCTPSDLGSCESVSTNTTKTMKAIVQRVTMASVTGKRLF